MQADDRTFSIGERAMTLMRDYSLTAGPRAYDVWYSYVAGVSPALNAALRSTVTAGGKVSEAEITALHDQHVSPSRILDAADRTGREVLGQIDGVMAMLDSAIGSTRDYGASLELLHSDLHDPGERRTLRDVLEALIAATRQVAAMNSGLERRLMDSRSEIANLRENLEAVRLEALIDPLTGLSNRRHFEATLAREAQAARQTGGELALIVIDIDHFKRFNDSYGHATGDQVLRLVGGAMRENVAGGATLARFGGEEFAIVLPGVDRAAARDCAELVRRNVEVREFMKRSTGESLGHVTISVGVAAIRDDDSASTLLERADLCMYEAKRAGRNRTVTDGSRRASDAA